MPTSRYFSVLTNGVALTLLLYPSLLLMVKGGVNGALLLLLLFALAASLARPSELSRVRWQSAWTPYLLAMLALPLATLVSQLFNHQFAGQPHDAPSRYWLAIPVFLLLQRLPLKVFASLSWAFPIAALLGWAMRQDVDHGRMGLVTMDLIHSGDIELLFGMLSLFCLDRRARWWENALKILGFAAGCAASLASGSRGGWLAMPIFLAIFIYFSPFHWRKTWPLWLLALLGVVFTMMNNPQVQLRTTALQQDILDYQQGKRDSSVGTRLQLYQAATHVFIAHPLVGVGVHGFAKEMQNMAQAGQISPETAELGKGEVHNDLLSKAVALGSLGLCALLAVYLVPLRLFWRATRLSAEQRHFGILGIVFISGCFVFGLTVEFLNLTLATAFYSLTVAILLAACYNQHHPSSSEGLPHV